MPVVPFSELPAQARVWVFGAARPITGVAAEEMLVKVDTYLKQWRAHGAPLVCAREWRDDHFLVVGVDEAATGATGCSVDSLFHVVRQVEAKLGITMVGGAHVFWRDAAGQVHSTDRLTFRLHGQSGIVHSASPVFDPTVTTVGAYRERFERPAADCWHKTMLPMTNLTFI